MTPPIVRVAQSRRASSCNTSYPAYSWWVNNMIMNSWPTCQTYLLQLHDVQEYQQCVRWYPGIAPMCVWPSPCTCRGGCVWRRAELVTGPSLHMSSPGRCGAWCSSVACMEFLCWKSVTVGSALSAGLVRLIQEPTSNTYNLHTHTPYNQLHSSFLIK